VPVEPLTPILDPTPNLDAARDSFDAYLARFEPADRVVALHDSDADGVTAGVVWQRALERLGYTAIERIIPDRERNAWSPAVRAG